MAGGRKAPAERRQHAAELRVDRVAIQTVRHDNLDARPAAVMQVRHDPNHIVRKNLAGWRMCQVVVAVSRGRPHPHALRRRLANDDVLDAGVERCARVRVESLDAAIGVGRIREPEIEAALA